VIDLEHASLEDFRSVVDQLDRDTCAVGERCDPENRCRRHTPRRKAA
jgi:hypothetical protein